MVEVGCGLVEDQHRLVSEQGAGDREPGPLSTRQPGMAVAEPCVEAVGQGGQPVAQPRLDKRCRDVVVRGVGAGEAHVLGDRGREHVRVVVDEPREPPYVVQRQVPQVDATVTHHPRHRVEEAHQQGGERALARPRGPDEGHDLPAPGPASTPRWCGRRVATGR